MTKKTLKNENTELRFFSFDEKLIDFIEQKYHAFFAVHNFGLRQSKGWGSYFPEEIKNTDTFEDFILESGCIVYRYEHNIGNNFHMEVSRIWQELKSGINHGEYKKSLLFKYAASKQIRWEKRAIKKALLSKINRENLQELIANHAPIDVDNNNHEGVIQNVASSGVFQ